jgi:hypothetical protein
MTRDDRAHLLLKGPIATFPWEMIALTHPVVAARNLPVLKAAFLNGIEEGHKEIVTVVFDRSVSSETFLDFVCALPQEFRGDVLMIEEGAKAYLASTTGDGRVLFRLEPRDLDLYMHARFDVDDPVLRKLQDEVSPADWHAAEQALLTGAYRAN